MTGFFPLQLRARALPALAVLGVTLLAVAQQPGTTDVPAPVVRVTTRMVLVDVVVTDSKRKPVTGLAAEDFTVFENGKPQQISVFSAERPWGRDDAKKLAEELPPLAPGVHTNRPEYRRPPGPPIVLLLDGLNTPVQDQIYVREKMLRFVAEFLQPDQYMAVVAMGERLHLLQDFTTDPSLLIAALEEWKAKPSVALAREERELDTLIAIAEAANLPITKELKAFLMLEASSALELRINSTLSTFESLARALAGIPGRKNLIWVSAVFPFEFRPDEPRDSDQFRYWKDFAAPIRRLGRLLADAQVAVYPVDARGLLDLGMGRAEERSFGTEPVRPSRSRVLGQLSEMEKRSLAVSSPQQTMRAIAEETGGVAFYNRNDLDRAVAQGIEDGSTYYLLGYYPTDKKWDGKYRRLDVKAARSDVRVRHRSGYYAIDTAAEDRDADKEQRSRQLLAALTSPLPATLVTFQARAIPPAPGTAGPVQVELEVDAASITYEEGEEGRRTANLDFLTTAYHPDGTLTANVYQTLSGSLPPEASTNLTEQRIPYRAELALPPGIYELRLAVRDNRTGFIGTLRIPLDLRKPQSASQ